MKKRIRLLLVDDHELVRYGLRRMLEAEPDMEIVGDCASAEEVLSQAVRLSPDIVLMDVQMPGMDGIEATRCLKQEGVDCDAGVIVLADCAKYLVEALVAGASGYLNKSAKRAELAETIRQVYQSEHSLEATHGSFIEEAVELVVPPPAAAGQMLRFVSQVEKRLNASTLQTVGSWDGGTIITILLKPGLLSSLSSELERLPDVEGVQEEPAAGEGFPGFLKQFKVLSTSGIDRRKRILITLKQNENQADMAAQELVTALI